MKAPKWVREIDYAKPKTKGGHDAMLLKSALLVALDLLYDMKKDHTTDTNQDCLGCDFGPCQSTTHHPGCIYLRAVQAVRTIEKLEP